MTGAIYDTAELVSAWLASDLTINGYASSHGVSYTTLRTHLYKAGYSSEQVSQENNRRRRRRTAPSTGIQAGIIKNGVYHDLRAGHCRSCGITIFESRAQMAAAGEPWTLAHNLALWPAFENVAGRCRECAELVKQKEPDGSE